MANSLSNLFKNLLSNPGDELNARITKTGRGVLKTSINNGKDKYSKTIYPNGTTVETKTTKS